MTPRTITCLALLALGACGGDGDPPASDAGPIDARIALDAPTTPDTGPPDAPTADAPADDAPRPDGAPVGGATLVGTVSRSTTDTFPVEPPPDGRGSVYLMVYETNPAAGTPGPAVASQALGVVDLSAPSLSVPYRLEGIPPRTEPYYVTAFLDDDANASPNHPCPNAGDSVATERFGVPTVVLDTETEHDFDVDLDEVLIFHPGLLSGAGIRAIPSASLP